MNNVITKISAEDILDSRGNPTLKVTVATSAGQASFSVPSGASTGKYEAHELRDNDKNIFNGLGVKKAVESVNEVISPALVGKDASEQNEIDRILIELDGTPNKEKLGGNALIGTSVACAKTAATSKGVEVFEHLRSLAEIKPSQNIPFLFMNLINGGKHASSRLAFQEYHVVPQTENIAQALDVATDIQRTLKELLVKELGPEAANLGDEGGFAPDLTDTARPLELMAEALKINNAESSVKLALDTAASSFFDDNDKTYLVNDKRLSFQELKNYYHDLIAKFPIMSIEDPFEENDFNGFAELLSANAGLFVVGDDLTVTNNLRLKTAMENKSINAIIIKPNQIGTLTETLSTMRLARENGIECIVSHRSGETEDDFIADLAFAFGCFGLKAGAPQRGERVVKYNRLKHIASL